MNKLDDFMKNNRPQLKNGPDNSELIWSKIQADKKQTKWHIISGLHLASFLFLFVIYEVNNFNYKEDHSLNFNDLSTDNTYLISEWENEITDFENL